MNADQLTPDLERQQRQGFPEVVFGQGKSPAQVLMAMQHLYQHAGHALATGVSSEAASLVKSAMIDAVWDEVSGTCHVSRMPERPGRPVVVSAGTSDARVTRETESTLHYLGYQACSITDAGVAGLHRLTKRLHDIQTADVVIVIAGMEGALASVVGGLVRQPVIAVPTSVGYGTGLGGLAALMSMLNSCAAGITVVNIDNGFGAAVAAHRIMAALSS